MAVFAIDSCASASRLTAEAKAKIAMAVGGLARESGFKEIKHEPGNPKLARARQPPKDSGAGR